MCFSFISSGRAIVCVRYGINYAKKQRLGGKKTSQFCSLQSHRQNETIQKKKKLKISAVSL